MTGHRPEPLRLVPPLQLVWSGAGDVLQTATDAHAEMDRLAYSQPPRVEPTAPWFVAYSRPRKAKRRNRFAVALLMVASAFIGGIFYAASARADSGDDWASIYGSAVVCSTLDDHPTVAGLIGVTMGVQQASGLTMEQAADAVVASVYSECPEYAPLLIEAKRRYGRVGA